MALVVNHHLIGLRFARSTTDNSSKQRRQRQQQHCYRHVLLAKSAPEGDIPGGKRIRLGPDLRPRECVLCIDGRGVVKCHNCDGEGLYYTKPGLAGKSNTVGLARCKMCDGTGLLSCMICGHLRIKRWLRRKKELESRILRDDPVEDTSS